MSRLSSTGLDTRSDHPDPDGTPREYTYTFALASQIGIRLRKNTCFL